MPVFSAHGMKRKKEIDSNTRPRKRRKIEKKLSDDEYSPEKSLPYENPLGCKYCLSKIRHIGRRNIHTTFCCLKNPDRKNVMCLICNLVFNTKKPFDKHIEKCKKIYVKKSQQLRSSSKLLYRIVSESKHPTNGQQFAKLTKGKIKKTKKKNKFICLCCNEKYIGRSAIKEHTAFSCKKNPERMNVLCDCGGIYSSSISFNSHRNKFCLKRKSLKLPKGIKSWPQEQLNLVPASEFPETGRHGFIEKQKKQKPSISKETAKALQSKTAIPTDMPFEMKPPIAHKELREKITDERKTLPSLYSSESYKYSQYSEENYSSEEGKKYQQTMQKTRQKHEIPFYMRYQIPKEKEPPKEIPYEQKNPPPLYFPEPITPQKYPEKNILDDALEFQKTVENKLLTNSYQSQFFNPETLSLMS